MARIDITSFMILIENVQIFDVFLLSLFKVLLSAKGCC